MCFMKRGFFVSVLVCLATGVLLPSTIFSSDYPHSSQCDIECETCHWTHTSGGGSLFPDWAVPSTTNIDDTISNNVCRGCHNDSGSAPAVETHSSEQTTRRYDDWAVECIVCHNPHHQKQPVNYNDASDVLYKLTSTGVTANTITVSGTPWSVNELAGFVLLPDINNLDTVSYEITSNTENTITIEDPVLTDDFTIDLTADHTAGDTFIVSYGQIINSEIDLSRITAAPGYPKSGVKTVKFVRKTGSNSFADGDANLDGVCEVCHTRTRHFQNNGNGTDQYHQNLDVAYTVPGSNCMECHKHTSGFMHGSGSGSCANCHGHDAGSPYDTDMTDGDNLTGSSEGAGSFRSHSTHTETDSDDQRGPGIYCNNCHDINNMPLFTDSTGTAEKLSLEDTDVCDTCHSPNGTYNGVDSTSGSVGAKNSWKDSVYDVDGNLMPSKEKWCAGCHDEDPSVISTAYGDISAPKVIGDEDAVTVYGTGYGFYKTGHGVPSDETYPASGGVVYGAGAICTDCHDSEIKHIIGDSDGDGNGRTFECTSTTADACTDDYKEGYRLKIGNKMPPAGAVEASYELCFSCHTDTDAWLTQNRNGTNFWDDGRSAGEKNLHEYHLTAVSVKTHELDWTTGRQAVGMSCITCHNVHGSKNPAMMRSGELTPAEWTDFMVRYANNDTVQQSDWEEPVPNNITLAESTKVVMRGDKADPYCGTCHGGASNLLTVVRDPEGIQELPPELLWAGYAGFESDGITPDAVISGDTLTFRVLYKDVNQDAPTVIRLHIDINDDGDYDDAGEHIALTQSAVELPLYSYGVEYYTSFVVNKADFTSDNVRYAFYGEAAGPDIATGEPTFDSYFQILNDAPRLEWTGETNYTEDGVDPNYGPKDGTFTFRVKYIDDDEDACPASNSSDIQVWIDLDGSGTFEGSELYNLAEVNGGDVDCTSAGNGKLYTVDVALPNDTGSTVTYDYRFYATDGSDDATGDPTQNSSVTVVSTTNNPPYLEWNPGACRPEGAMPPTAATNSDITFSVCYFDADGGDATDIQVWVDLNDDGDYDDTGEKNNLTLNSSASGCSGGKVYEGTVTAPSSAYSDIPYEFHATDGTDEALGAPRETGGTIDVVVADYIVDLVNGPYYTITDGLAAVGTQQYKTVLVYAGTYNSETSGADPKLYITQDYTYILSACGPDETIVTNLNSSVPVVEFYRTVDTTWDGFTVTGGAGQGIYVKSTNYTPNSTPTITNSVIRDNGGRGLYNEWGYVTISDSEVYNNLGGGLSMAGGSTITNTIIRDNEASGNGGGLLITGGDTVLTDVTFTGNSAPSGSGGAISCTAGHPDRTLNADYVVVSDNTAGATGGGVLLNECQATFTNALISDNEAPQGGGIESDYASSAWLESSTIVNNNATAGNGGAFCTSGGVSGGVVHFVNTIAWGNRATGTGYIGYLQSDNKTVNLYDSVIENNGDTNITDDNYFVINGTGSSINDSGSNYDDNPNFVDPNADGDYHVNTPSIALDNAADNSGRGIPTDDLEHTSRPSGSEDIGAYEYVESSNDHSPELSWTGQTDFTADGVNPDQAVSGTTFEFRVQYDHVDNVAPDPIQIWVDEDDNGGYDATEKYTMSTYTSSSQYDDGVYDNGEWYTRTLTLYLNGGGDMKYRFYASDGKDLATTDPAVTHYLYVDNGVPELTYVGDTNYESDGVHPNTGDPGDSFVFRVRYTDSDNLDNTVPPDAYVWVDLNDNGFYDLSTEQFSMTPEAGTGTDHDGIYSNGEVYVSSPITIDFAGNGVIEHRFYFTDGGDAATGTPCENRTVVLNNTTPGLVWTGETYYVDDGVDPYTNVDGGSYTFRVDYYDAENSFPDEIQVWVDLDDSGTYETSNSNGDNEEIDLAETDALDTTFTSISDPKRFAVTLNNVSYDGDGELMYRFFANDGRDDATGDPTSTKYFNVMPGTPTPVTVNFTTDTQTAFDESATAYTITAQLSGTWTEDVTVNYVVSGTAEGGGTDYTITSSPITITAGNTTEDITVTVVQDTEEEGDETVIVTMTDTVNAIRGTTSEHTLTIRDDDGPPTNTFSSGYYTADKDTMVLYGTKFTTIDAVGTDIKGYMDWGKFVWDTNGGTITVTDYLSDVDSLTITDDSTLTLVFTSAKGSSIEGTTGYGGGDDTLDITAGFSRNASLLPATTDALVDGLLEVYDCELLVTTNADELDSPLTCGADCSLREAISVANAGGSTCVIRIPEDTYTITLSGTDYNNAVGDFDVKANVTLIGAGEGKAIVEGSASGCRVFQKGSGYNVTFRDMTIRNGDATGLGTSSGGCIYGEYNTLTLERVTFDNCKAGNGGAVYLAEDTSSLNVVDSTFTNNEATTYAGGAIWIRGQAVVSSSTFTGNTAQTHGGAITNVENPLTINAAGDGATSVFNNNVATTGSGGAIYHNVSSNSDALTISNASFDGNTANSGNGGAVGYNTDKSSTPTYSFTESSLTNNSANRWGGAIFNRGPVTFDKTTVANNTVKARGGGVTTWNGVTATNSTFSANINTGDYSSTDDYKGKGGAIYAGTSATINNCTFYDNSATTGGAAVFASSGSPKNSIFARSTDTGVVLCNGLSSGGYNLQYNGTCFGAGTGDISADPLLDVLKDNGGFGHTHALLNSPLSPAIDAADNGTCESTDQRDQARPVDGDGDLTDTCDIGAYEYVP